MKVLTWNLNGLDEKFLDERSEAAVITIITGARLDEIERGAKPWTPPDVVLLQEVVERSYFAHIRQHLSAVAYTILPGVAPQRQTFEVIAFRAPYTLYAYKSEPLTESVFGRVLHIADLNGPNGLVRVMTAHFDSGTESGRVRTAQLRQIDANLGPAGVFGGDANLRKAEWLTVKDELPMTDAWETLGEPAATRATWKRDDYKARFDRMWLGSRLEAKRIQPVGTTNVPGTGGPPSDHIGLLLDLQQGQQAQLGQPASPNKS
jgi:endonuclease/exonuclease/phosphatase family metal-dependent hydrolase